MSADVEMGVGGFLVGAMAGGMIAVGQAAGRAVHDIARQQRTLSTIGRWQEALANAKTRAIRAERRVAKQAAEIAALREALALARYEVACLRQC
jgi:hypothetical protein